MSNTAESFGSMVFTDAVMRERLDADVYGSLRAIRDTGAPWNEYVADDVAAAMRDWAMEKGATHYTHWFSPMTGMSAGKHVAFLSGDEGGSPLFSFSGSTLTKGESDASSLPSGGLRSTFEARGYTAWDPTSPAFILGTTLYIPTAFCSYNGEALDQKTPLLRSMQAINKQAVRLLRLLGDRDTTSVAPTAGAEQEYFLVDRDMYVRRTDLQVCGRTLIGARSPKGQELDDHYYGRIRTRVMAFMEDLDRTLWSLGVPSKARHNETAPSQHEIALIYESVNVACDHNQLLMQVIRTVARRHNLACLLHEKPFEGINGSGKHNNWSLATDLGENLLDPGEHPEENLRFLLFLTAVLSAVDRHADLIRLSAASAGNDHRLGGNEAPPAVISVFLGEHLTGILRGLAEGYAPHEAERGHLLTGVKYLPLLEIDDCDRNRTSPFAFTGNKFEFRMVGSSQSIGFPNTVLNTAVAEALAGICERLESSDRPSEAGRELVGQYFREHSRVVFNGNNYTAEWRSEAARRGLPSFETTVDAAPALVSEENMRLFSRHKVLSASECRSRYEIALNNYSNVVSIEVGIMSEMIERQVLPAMSDYAGQLARDVADMKAMGAASSALGSRLVRLSELIDRVDAALAAMTERFRAASSMTDHLERAAALRGLESGEMAELRRCCDLAEGLVPADRWPIPGYIELLYKQ